MSTTHLIRRVLILDDNPSLQEDYILPIEAADLTPVLANGPLGTLDEFLRNTIDVDAAISDYQLAPGNYASFDGADLVSAWYKRHFPAVLCTSFNKSNAPQFRALRRWIPVIMSPHELDPDSLVHGLQLVNNEFEGDFTPARKPWRALVRFVEFDEATNTANAKVPGWANEVVAMWSKDLPDGLLAALRSAFTHGDEFRCFAIANLGAESNEELYLTSWSGYEND